MSEFGKCQHKGCDAEAVVGINRIYVNRIYVCQTHFDEALKKAKQNVDRMMKGLRP